MRIKCPTLASKVWDGWHAANIDMVHGPVVVGLLHYGFLPFASAEQRDGRLVWAFSKLAYHHCPVLERASCCHSSGASLPLPES